MALRCSAKAGLAANQLSGPTGKAAALLPRIVKVIWGQPTLVDLLQGRPLLAQNRVPPGISITTLVEAVLARQSLRSEAKAQGGTFAFVVPPICAPDEALAPQGFKSWGKKQEDRVGRDPGTLETG